MSFAVEPYRARVRYRAEGRDRVLTLEVAPGEGPSWSGAAEDGRLRLELELEGGEDALVVRGRVVALEAGLRLDRVEPLELRTTAPLEDPAVFHHGWQSWSATCALDALTPEPRPRGGWRVRDVLNAPHPVALDGPGHASSEGVIVVSERDGRSATALGFVTSASQFGAFEARTQPGAPATLRAFLPFDGVDLELGHTRELEELRGWRGDDASALLERWSEELGARMEARVPERSLVGWCSWYEYFTKIDAPVIRANLNELARLGDELPVGLFQIDDGWQAALGDWLEPNAKFPDGVAVLAREIDAAGFAPGLWLAPFVARPESRLFREHPGWFVRDDRDRARYALYNPLWGVTGTARALDTSHPEVLAWLGEVFRRLAGEWGFRFLKIDFLYAAALPGRRHDPRCTGAEALRRGLEAIRAAVGDDVHLLGCGSPLGPAVGLVDSMRIGIDVAPHWSDPISRWIGRDHDMPSTKNALRNVMTRAHQHGRLWQNDPDCLLVRARRTRLDLEEVRTLASLAALSGGTLLVSDDLTRLERERLPIARRAIEIGREIEGARPHCLDLMERSFPTLLCAERRGAGGYLAVVNPEDRPVRRGVALRRRGAPAWLADGTRAVEVWTQRPAEIRDGELAVGEIPPHGTRLYLVEAG